MDLLEMYLTYKFVTYYGVFAVYNSVLLVFRIAQVRICRFKEKYLKWVIKTQRPVRVYYTQNSEWEYVHPCYSKYIEIENIFWRGDLKDLKNLRINLFFSQ